jgi:hypothetical protein
MSKVGVVSYHSGSVGILVDGKKYVIGNGGSSGYIPITTTSKFVISTKTKTYSLDCNLIISNPGPTSSPNVYLYDNSNFPNPRSNGGLVVYVNLTDGTYICLNGNPGSSDTVTISNLVKPVTITDPLTYVNSMIPHHYTKIVIIMLILIIVLSIISFYAGHRYCKKI